MSESGSLEKLLEITALCNGAKIEPPSDRNKTWSIIGDPTDGALLVAATKFGLNIEETLAEKPIIDILPFSFERKRMTTVHKVNDEIYIYTKGAPTSIMSICKKILLNGKVEELEEENLQWIHAKNHEFGNEGLRVIAVAYKKLSAKEYTKGQNVEE